MINATWIGWNQSVSLNVKLMLKIVFGMKLIDCTDKNQNAKEQIQNAMSHGLLSFKKMVNLIKKMI